MKWSVDSQTGTYILRYYLPCEPIYDDGVINRRIESLIEYCVENRISAVMLYVDLNPFWYYAPDNLEHTRYYVSVIKPLAEKMQQNGISYQLNYQNLVGAWDGGADLRYINNWENYVDEKGIESRGCACNIGKMFRAIAGEKLRLWAATLPDVIWIDDDIRFHNHRTSIDDLWSGNIATERLDFGCFCDDHIKLFNTKNHTHLSRDDIVEGILSGSNNNELRKKWLDFSGECADELAEWIKDTIHEVSPGTRVAIMTSLPDVHSVEGRNWGSFLSGLSGSDKPLLRPTFGPYTEKNPQDFFASYLVVEQLKANIKHQYKKDFEFCPEIENTRFTRWSKSIAATGYQIMLSAFLGCKGVTLSIYDLEGCILQEEPEFAELLDKNRPFFDKMAELDLWEWKSEGVNFITAPDRISAPSNMASVSEMKQLATGRLWDEVLPKAGIPCAYITPDQILDCKCVALDKYTVGLLTDEELLHLLAKGMLIDAGAAEILEQRGFSEYTGVTVSKRIPCIAATEMIHPYRRSDGSSVRIPARIDGRKWSELHLNRAQKITSLVTPDGKTYPGITCFTNQLGGTVYIYAGNGVLGDGFYSNYRIRLFKDICRNISGDSIFSMNNASYAMLAVKRKPSKNRRKEQEKAPQSQRTCLDDERTTYAAFVVNMSADPLKEIQLQAPSSVKHAVIIDSAGVEHNAAIDGNTILYDAGLNLYDAMVCMIEVE